MENQLKDRFGPYQLFTGFESPRHCFWCGKEVDGRRRYCSEEHNDLYWKHFAWPSAAAWCLKRYDHKCADCGMASDKRPNWVIIPLVAHHIDPLNGEERVWNIKNRPENVIALCPACHGKRHSSPKTKAKREVQSLQGLLF